MARWRRIGISFNKLVRAPFRLKLGIRATSAGGKQSTSTLASPMQRSDPIVTPAEFLDAEPDGLDAIVSVVIPTLNAGCEFPLLLKKLKSQKGLRKVEIIIVDSGSSDDTVELACREQCNVVSIDKVKFSHSYARNKGAEIASGDYILFMVQDAYPIGDYWLARLVHGLRGAAPQGLVALSCAEFPRADTELFYNVMIDIHYKFLGCADQDRVGAFRGDGHVALRQQGQLSDVACLISRDVFDRYKYHGRYAEDLLLGVQLIKDGHKVAMISNLRVVHSHNRSQGYYLRRAFVDVVFLVAAFPDHPIPPVQRLAGILTAATVLGQHITERKLETGLDADRFLSQLIGGLRDLQLPSQAVSFTSAISCDHSPFQSWLEHCESENSRPSPILSDEERRTAITARDMFCDRLRGLQDFARGVYPVADESIARQFNDAIQKSLAMSLGAHLAFAYLRRSEMPKVDTMKLEKLMPLMIEDI